MTFKERIIDIRNSKWFSNLTTSIIIFYAAALGFKTVDDLSQPFGMVFYSIDIFITIYFLIEIIIKMSAEENLKDFFKDKWNVFDFVIVTITLIPLENSSFAAIARLMRIFRVLRLLTSRPELKKIIDMLIGAIPSIVDIVILMFIIFYIYAIVGNFFFSELKSGLWNDFLTSMLTLFRVLTFEDWTDVMYEAMEVYPWAWAYFVSFVIIAAFVFFNLFVAVIIGEMEKIQNEDKDEQLNREEEKIDLLLKEVRELRTEIDKLKK
ncbi:MAG: ion transporter [Campylobacterota bacterium]|nr:ion transporter [Campylobacterota bacterium]